MQHKSALRGGDNFKHHVSLVPSAFTLQFPRRNRINSVPLTVRLPLLFIQMKANKALNLFYFRQQWNWKIEVEKLSKYKYVHSNGIFIFILILVLESWEQ